MTVSIHACALSDITDGQAKGITLNNTGDRLDVLVARRGASVFAYVNSCPHAGSPLDWQPDRFMSADGTMLQCATHGAQFGVEDGLCIRGPCVGQRLTKLETRIRGNQVAVLWSEDAVRMRQR